MKVGTKFGREEFELGEVRLVLLVEPEDGIYPLVFNRRLENGSYFPVATWYFATDLEREGIWYEIVDAAASEYGWDIQHDRKA